MICRHIMTGSYNNFFKMFDRTTNKETIFETCRDNIKPKQVLKPRKVSFSTNLIFYRISIIY